MFSCIAVIIYFTTNWLWFSCINSGYNNVLCKLERYEKVIVVTIRHMQIQRSVWQFYWKHDKSQSRTNGQNPHQKQRVWLKCEKPGFFPSTSPDKMRIKVILLEFLIKKHIKTHCFDIISELSSYFFIYLYFDAFLWMGTRKAENQKGRRPKRPLTKKALPKRPQT